MPRSFEARLTRAAVSSTSNNKTTAPQVFLATTGMLWTGCSAIQRRSANQRFLSVGDGVSGVNCATLKHHAPGRHSPMRDWVGGVAPVLRTLDCRAALVRTSDSPDGSGQ